MKQQVELLEVLFECETNNRYDILNPEGNKVFYAKEDTDCCTRNCCGNYRPFDMKLTDVRTNQEVIHLYRPLACSDCCFPCWLQSIRVESPPGNLIGTVQQKWSIFHPKYEVLDETGKALYFIQGPCCVCHCLWTVNFEIFHAHDGSNSVGRISKNWSGLAKEGCPHVVIPAPLCIRKIMRFHPKALTLTSINISCEASLVGSDCVPGAKLDDY